MSSAETSLPELWYEIGHENLRLEIVRGLARLLERAFDIGGEEGEVVLLLQQVGRRLVEVLFAQLHGDGRVLHLEVVELELPLHLLDVAAHPAQFALDRQQVGDLAVRVFEEVLQLLLHPARVVEPRLRVVIVLGHVFRADRLVLHLAEVAQLEQKVVEILRQHLDHHGALQLAVAALLRIAGVDVTARRLRQRRDLIHRALEAFHFKIELRVADQFAGIEGGGSFCGGRNWRSRWYAACIR